MWQTQKAPTVWGKRCKARHNCSFYNSGRTRTFQERSGNELPALPGTAQETSTSFSGTEQRKSEIPHEQRWVYPPNSAMLKDHRHFQAQFNCTASSACETCITVNCWYWCTDFILIHRFEGRLKIYLLYEYLWDLLVHIITHGASVSILIPY